jgi:hypothetical protein
MPKTDLRPEERCFYAVTGMHRSHTSLLGRMLVDAGLRFHDDLVSSDATNPYGHYEDVDLLRVQRAVLADNGARWFRRTGPQLAVSCSRRREVQEIVVRRYEELGNGWGFKVPDTSLLLDFWADWPDARFLLIFREPAKVLSSLYRRMGAQFYYRPDAWHSMAEAYADYNERLLAHRLAYPDRTFLIDSRDLVTRPAEVLRAAADKLQMPIHADWSGASMIDREIVSARPQPLERQISQLFSKRRRLQYVYSQLVGASDSAALG